VPLEDVMALTVVGFLFLYVISRLISVTFSAKTVNTSKSNIRWAGFLQPRNFPVHSFIDGLASDLVCR